MYAFCFSIEINKLYECSSHEFTFLIDEIDAIFSKYLALISSRVLLNNETVPWSGSPISVCFAFLCTQAPTDNDLVLVI